MPFRLTTNSCACMIMWQCSGLLAPHMMQRGIPRNTSRLFSPVLNAVVVDKSDSGRSDQAYPEGGPCVRRGSWNVGRGTMMANAARAG
jgi:hypothetical protein